MKKGSSLFSISSESLCYPYQRVRNGEDENCRRIKAHCEDLWRDYKEHADSHFVDQFARNFHQRWFEMYLTVSLIRAGVVVKSKDSGPDVFVTIGERRVWIEAVCTTEGEEGKPDSVPRSECGGQVPIKQDVLRIRSSLHDKAKRFKEYLEKGMVQQDDILMIAISVGGNADMSIETGIYQLMARSLYGLGDPVVSLNRHTREVVDLKHDHVPIVKKASGAEIGTLPFVDGSMDHVFAVLESSANAGSRLSTLGGDFVLYPNLSCRNPWVKGLLPVAEEWSFEKDQ